ncbi:MAG: GGDEF domain-containing protein [Pararhizobium sp.]
MTKDANPAANVLLKVAGTMHRLGIDGLPRNYELVYEAMAGTRPDLTRAFLALGPNRSQAALDELGRRHLSHHHESEIVNRSNETVRDELDHFIRLVHRETSSLKHFGNLLDETSRRLAVAHNATPRAIDDAVRTIAAATAQKAAEGQVMADEVAEHSSRLQKVAGELDAFEKLKLADPLTGLPNRRAFDRELAVRYGAPNGPDMTALAICDIDNFAAINGRFDPAVGDMLVRHVARIIERSVDTRVFAARTGGGQFGFVMQVPGESAVIRLCEQIRIAVAMTPLAVGEDLPLTATASFGVCMSDFAETPKEIIAHAASAVARAKAEGRNRTEVYTPPTAQKLVGNDWMLYRP